ncbi:MAG: diadenylate cyclase CdaA [Chloroflexi bacterium]|nr:diadenylate cyclase CdaA [Chloroflexota bacterium]MBU1661860.1 diadenylate cyclase CdaA [Chloroflexota bacterium]
MPELISNLVDYLVFIFERLDWLSVFDILLVTAIFFVILFTLRDTQAMMLLRGGLLLIALLGLLTSLEVLPAFSWLVGKTLPALVFAIPVIFAPEIRRALERLGRTGSLMASGKQSAETFDIVGTLVTAAASLSDRKHGALIVLQRIDSLQEYIITGVPMDAHMSSELLLQIFYPNTPLHDGAVIVRGSRVVAASCVMPLSASGSLLRSPERAMGLRHRAALGTSEVGDAVSIVVSEETGTISITHSGRVISNLNTERLKDILQTFYQPLESKFSFSASFWRLFPGLAQRRRENK